MDPEQRRCSNPAILGTPQSSAIRRDSIPTSKKHSITAATLNRLTLLRTIFGPESTTPPSYPPPDTTRTPLPPPVPNSALTVPYSPPATSPIADFPCSLDRPPLNLSGRIYITSKHVSFYSNLFGFEKKVAISVMPGITAPGITAVTKLDWLGGEGITITTPADATSKTNKNVKYLFKSFPSAAVRDECYEQIMNKVYCGSLAMNVAMCRYERGERGLTRESQCDSLARCFGSALALLSTPPPSLLTHMRRNAVHWRIVVRGEYALSAVPTAQADESGTSSSTPSSSPSSSPSSTPTNASASAPTVGLSYCFGIDGAIITKLGKTSLPSIAPLSAAPPPLPPHSFTVMHFTDAAIFAAFLENLGHESPPSTIATGQHQRNSFIMVNASDESDDSALVPDHTTTANAASTAAPISDAPAAPLPSPTASESAVPVPSPPTSTPAEFKFPATPSTDFKSHITSPTYKWLVFDSPTEVAMAFSPFASQYVFPGEGLVKYHEKVGDFAVSCDMWADLPAESSPCVNVYSRKLNFTHPVDAPIGPKETRCVKSQVLRLYSAGLVIETTTTLLDIPYGDCFHVVDRIVVDGGGDGAEKVRVWIEYEVVWQKGCMWKSIVEKRTKSETKDWQVQFWKGIAQECGGGAMEEEKVAPVAVEVGGGGGWSGLGIGSLVIALVVLALVVTVVVTHLFTVAKISTKVESLEKQLEGVERMVKLLLEREMQCVPAKLDTTNE